MTLIVWVLLSGAVLLAIGIYQMQTYFAHPHFQEAKIIGFERYKSNIGGLEGIVADAASNAAGMRYPVVDVLLDDGSFQTVRLNVTVTDDTLRLHPDLDIGGTVNVQFFGDNPKIAYLTNHPLAQTVVKVSGALLAGIALLVLTVILVITYILAPTS